MRAFVSFMFNALKARSKESTTRIQTTFIILLASLWISIVLIAYLFKPTVFGTYTVEILLALTGLITVALTGKVVSGRNESRRPNNYYDYTGPTEDEPYTDKLSEHEENT
jgi:hypothetical protein